MVIFASVLDTVRYTSVYISVKATLSGQSPGVTHVTFSVLFQSCHSLFGDVGAEGQAATTFRFKVPLRSNKHLPHAVTGKKAICWELL